MKRFDNWDTFVKQTIENGCEDKEAPGVSDQRAEGVPLERRGGNVKPEEKVQA